MCPPLDRRLAGHLGHRPPESRPGEEPLRPLVPLGRHEYDAGRTPLGERRQHGVSSARPTPFPGKS
ncbi:MAG TPA: hypothetical protein VD948_04225, partial [Rhodothermales bacterium]|nr:hypothetical protein [Rhodothermales bacterium]